MSHIESYESQHIRHYKNALFLMSVVPIMVFGLVFLILAISNTNIRSKAQSVSCTQTISSGDPGVVMNSMSSGQTLCLNSGNYTAKTNGGGNYTLVTVSGVTMTAAPGATPNIAGAFEVRGDNNTFNGLTINGEGVVQGTFLIISGADNNKITNNDIRSYNGGRGMCIIVGEGGSTHLNGPINTLIEGNRIHDCGDRENDQGIYINSGRNGLVRNNYIYDNPDFAIQFYRTAQNNIVEFNTMDNNKRGVTISSESGYTPSSNNIVRNNIITNSKGNIKLISGAPSTYSGYNVDYYWGGGAGSGNQVTGNCTFGAKTGEIRVAPSGISYSGNIVGDPGYANVAAKNFTIGPGSPCAGKGVQVAAVPAPVPPPVSSPPPATTPAPSSPPANSGSTASSGNSSAPAAAPVPSIKVPENAATDQQGNLLIDVDGDGRADTVKDLNNDGVIDLGNELITDNYTYQESSYKTPEAENSGSVTELPLPFSDQKIRIPSIVGAGFVLTQAGSALALLGYLIFVRRWHRQAE